jgi:hypothetical protein
MLMLMRSESIESLNTMIRNASASLQ